MNETAPKMNISLYDIVGNGLCAVPDCIFKEISVEWHIGHSLHILFETSPFFTFEYLKNTDGEILQHFCFSP